MESQKQIIRGKPGMPTLQLAFSLSQKNYFYPEAKLCDSPLRRGIFYPKNTFVFAEYFLPHSSQLKQSTTTPICPNN